MFGLLPLILLILVLPPILFFLLYFNLATFSLAKLGLSSEGALVFLTLTLIGSVINIPVSRKRYVIKQPHMPLFPFIFYYPPEVSEQVIAVNLGGAVIPSLFALYLFLTRAPLLPTLVCLLIVTWASKRLARPVPGIGITMPAFVPPLIATAAALIFSPPNTAPVVAYISGVWGTLIGADLLNMKHFHRLGSQMVSIGGAGIYDGIFLVGITAALLS
jgi:uncharacterized membrane protein